MRPSSVLVGPARGVIRLIMGIDEVPECAALKKLDVLPSMWILLN